MMARIPRSAVPIGTFVLVFSLMLALPRGAAAQDPNAFITNLGTQAIQVMGPSMPAPQRLARFRELLRDYFDVSGIGQFVLGRYWRTATPQEQQEFLKLFQEYVAQAYSGRLGRCRRTVQGDRQPTERRQIMSAAGRAQRRPDPDRLVRRQPRRQAQIADGICRRQHEGDQRDEFASIIQRDGGKIDGLLNRLRQKTATP